MTGVIAAMSQLFSPPFNEDVQEVRKEHREARNNRDTDRVESVLLLQELINLKILPDTLNSRAENLVTSHSLNEKKSESLYNDLKALKKSKKVNGFQNLNIFLANMGNPVFILITGILFMILFLFRKRIDWLKLSKSFLYLSLMYLFVSSVYLIWGISNSMEIHKIYYVTGLVFASLFAMLGLRSLLFYLFKINSIEEEKLLKAIRILFRQLLHTVPKKNYVKDDKFVEYTESNNRIINEVAETID
ncbi:hypothetical protein U8527_06700 [Kordia algicida OT-1]|uniref:Uncharacterized protein n=1 Tax=Kordia algicida OT-1 TaxID=391587 RepID=A9CU96_9FLAO|nr:hypothetical protein [Kordia algicida]EDP94139.1 hypothetical protein KAOT1_00125 [Kordia algicida OT-1]